MIGCPQFGWCQIAGAALLAQGAQGLQPSAEILKSAGWIVLAIVILIAIAYFFRRWLLHDSPSNSSLYTLGQLRQMLEEGVLSQEEFDRAKQSVIEQNNRIVKQRAKQSASGDLSVLDTMSETNPTDPPPNDPPSTPTGSD